MANEEENYIEVKIGAWFPVELKDNLIAVLREFHDDFA